MAHQFPDLFFHGINALVAVDHFHALRFSFGEVKITSPHPLVELQRLIFHAVEQFAATCPLQADPRVEVDDERQVGNAIADGKSVDRGDVVGVEFAADALVDSGRVKKPVANDYITPGERGLDDFAHKLGAAGAEQQEFCLGNHGGRSLAVLKDVTDLFAHFCPSGLANDHDRPPHLSQSGHEMVDMCGFAASLPALKSDKFAVSLHFLRILKHHTICAK